MGSEKKRLKILNKLKEQFLEANNLGKGIDKEGLISEICMNYGVTKEKSLEYIQVLFDGKFIVEDLGNLWLASGIKSQTLSPEEEAMLKEKNLEQAKISEAIMQKDEELREQGAVD